MTSTATITIIVSGSKRKMDFRNKMTSYKDGDFDIIITSNDANKKYKCEYSEGYLETTELEEDISFFGLKHYKQQECVEYDLTEYLDDKTFAQSYSSKTQCVLSTKAGNHLRYWNGTKGKDVGYCKIVCKATYRIKNNVSDVQNFKNKIKSSNRNITRSGRSSAVSIAGAVALYAFIGFMTEGVALLILGSATGMGQRLVNIYNAFCDEIDAHEYYDQAKAYGKNVIHYLL